MKRFTALALSLFLFPLFSYSQAIPSPTIRQEGRGWGELIPKNWNIIVADSADFNNDMREDFVFVLQAEDEYLRTMHYDMKFSAPPRILLVLMGAGDVPDSVVFGVKSDSVVLRAGESGDADPVNVNNLIKTDGNILELDYSAGVSIQWTAQYKFAYNKSTKDWTLAYYRGTEYNTSDEDAPIKVIELDFNKKFMKQDKVKTPMPNLPKLSMDKFKPRTVTVAPGVVL